MRLLILIAFFVSSFAIVSEASYSADIESVISSLPNLIVIPLETAEDPLNITLSFRLVRVVDVDLGEGVMRLAAIPILKWTDFRVANSWKNNAVSQVHIQPGNIWMPDLRIYNSIGSVNDESEITSSGIVHSNGTVVLSEPRYYEVVCDFDAYLFPFDTQKCSLNYGTWTHSRNEIILQAEALESPPNPASGWFVDPIEASVTTADELEYSQTIATFAILVRRSWSPYMLNIVAPTVLISLLSLLIFLLPVHSGEKVDFGVTIFLTLCVNSLVLADAVPASSSKVPLITWVNSMVTAMVAGSILAAIITTRFLQTSGKTPPIPTMLHMVLFYVGKVFCIQFRRWEPLELKIPSVPISIPTNISTIPLIGKSKDKSVVEEEEEVGKSASTFETGNQEPASLDDILDQVKSIRGIIEGNEVSNANFEEWVKLANLIDKIFAFAFLLIFCVVIYIFGSKLGESGVLMS